MSSGRPLRTLALAILALGFGLLEASPLWAQQVRIVGPAQSREATTVHFTAHLSGEVTLGPAGPSIRPRVARPGGGTFDALWQEPYEISWTFGDSGAEVYTGERPTVAHVFRQQGTYTVAVEVRNQHGLITRDSREITIENARPSIDSMGILVIDQDARTVELSSQVVDTPEDTLTYTWDFGDGSSQEGVDLWRVRHTWRQDGTYVVTLRVADGDGGEDVSTAEVVVGPRERTSLTGGDDTATSLAVSSFAGTTSEGISASLDARVKPFAGLYLGSPSPGVCQLSFSAWDPSQLVNVTFIARLRGLREGRTRFRLANPQFFISFHDTAERYRAQEMVLQVGTLGSGLAGLRGLLGGLGSTPTPIREDIGVDPTATPERPVEERAPVARSPFGLRDSVSYESRSGAIELVVDTHDRAEATFDVLLENTDEDAEHGPPTLRFQGTTTINLQTARSEGLVSYRDCMQQGFAITRTSPQEGTQHALTTSSPSVVFSEPYDPETLHEGTFQVGYLDTAQVFVPVKGRIVRNERSALLVPEEPLLGGVRYEARVRTGPAGVRGKNGEELADLRGEGHHAWSFVTRLVFRVEAGRQTNHLGCHVLQTVRDAPLIKGKPTVARVYGAWAPHPGVLASDQVESFSARVMLMDPSGRELASASHEFVRPDLWKARAISLPQAEHTANLFGWAPDGTEGSQPRIAIQAETRLGTWETVYGARCPADYWRPQPTLNIDYYLLDMGEWFLWPPDTTLPTLHAVYSQGEQYALQVFPFKSIRGRYRGMMRLGTLSQAQLAYVRAQNAEKAGATPEENAARMAAASAAAGVLATELVTTYATMHGAGADLVLAFGPRSHLSGGNTPVSLLDGAPGAIYSFFDDDPTLRDRYVYAWVHEVGHYLLLPHIPFITTVEEQLMMRDMRDSPALQYDGVEGFRILRGGWTGWNKSSTEGNGEGPRIAPLMFPATIPYRNTFIATHHYRQIQRDIEANGLFRTGANLRAEPVLFASAASSGAWAALQQTPEPARWIGLAGVIGEDEASTWIGPLVGGAPAAVGASGEYRVSLLDEAGGTLGSSSFDVRPSSHEAPSGVFRASVPWSDRARTLVVARGDSVLVRRDRSAHRPSVTMTAPHQGQQVANDLTLSWVATDEDGDALTSTVLYSPDGGGAGWSVLALWLDDRSFTVDTAMLEPGPNPTVRVLVSDGFDEAEAQVSVGTHGRLDVLAALPAADVPAAQSPDITILFNSDVTPESAVTAQVVLRSGTGRNQMTIEGSLSYDQDARALTFRPASPLVGGTRYQATLTGALVNRFGGRLQTPYTWSFTVMAE
jgi:PKD repeat protein